MGASEDIISAENVLRDLIETVLSAALGLDWLEKSGLTAERLDGMRGRLAAETASRPGGTVEQRLIYYSDLPDLKTIIDKNWERFKPCLGEKKACDVNLDRLADFRIAEMHGRPLLPFELSLTAGISGEIRNRVAIFRSEMGPSREYFPRIEYVRDSFGNVRRGHGSAPEGSAVRLILHPGDEIVFDCHAWDPDNLPFTWSVLRGSGGRLLDASASPEFVWRVAADDIADPCTIFFYLKSTRAYHRNATYDDGVSFSYTVLPRG
jgi:hypothetical protein